MTDTLVKIPDAAAGEQFRAMQIREVNAEARTLTGLVVSYGETIEVDGMFRERFDKGSVGGAVGRPLFYGHDHRQGATPIGVVIEERDLDEGHEITARISDTPKGNEVHTLLRDGVIKTFSAGFNPVENRVEDDVVVRVATEFLEASVTPFAAYKSAKVSEVRSADKIITKEKDSEMETTDEQVAGLRDTVTDLERKLAVLADAAPTGPRTSQFRDAGTLLKALATGDKGAQAELRDFATTVDAGTRPVWVDRPFKFVENRRPLINLFGRDNLPSTGMSIEYPTAPAVAGTVGVQAAQGDALPYMEIQVGDDTVPVKTYGGYSSVSRQVIDRRSPEYLTGLFRFMAIQYAKATNAAAIAALTGSTGFNTGTLAADTGKGWTDLVVDALGKIEDNSFGLDGEFIVASTDVYARLAGISDGSGRPIFVVNGDGQNTVGNVNVKARSFSVANVPGKVVGGLPANSLWVASSEALTVLESPGAPFRLEDENVINLTKDFSLYGYLATTLNDAKGLYKADVDLV